MNKSLRSLMIAVGLGASAAVGGALMNYSMSSVSFARAEREVADARTSLAEASDLSSVFKTVSKAVEPSVVQIQTKTTISNPMSGLRRMLPFGIPGAGPDEDNQDDAATPSPGNGDEEQYSQGTGSGVIMEISGDTAFVLTNNHVVANANTLSVTLNDGRVITDAKVVGTDPRTDLAVVKIRADKLIAAQWGDSSKLEKGDWVIAFGSPFGYVGSMTHGIVSALNRQVGILGRMGFEEFIQTDAAINPGNSGGPLVNTHGEVIGINSAIASRSGGFQGLGFAVPTKIAKPVFEHLKAEGKMTRGWLGVSIADVSSPDEQVKTLVDATGYKGNNGVLIVETVRGGPAVKTLRAGDVVTGLDGKPIKNSLELREYIASQAPGAQVKMQLFRDGKTVDESIKLGEQPDDVQMAANGAGPQQRLQRAPARGETVSGLTLRNPTEALLKQHDLDASLSGALVTNVQPGTGGFRAGLRTGDVITSVNGKEIKDAAEAAKAIRDAEAGKPVRLNVTNAEGSRLVVLRTR